MSNYVPVGSIIEAALAECRAIALRGRRPQLRCAPDLADMFQDELEPSFADDPAVVVHHAEVQHPLSHPALYVRLIIDPWLAPGKFVCEDESAESEYTRKQEKIRALMSGAPKETP